MDSKRIKDDENGNNSVLVQLSNDRTYPIVFRSLNEFGRTLGTVLQQRKGSRCVVVSNNVVGPLHKDAIIRSLESSGWKTQYVEILDGEEQKTVATYVKLVDDLLNLKVDRKTVLVGLGGGVTTDIVGFAAATTLRGLTFANVPTSLLAMVDASVGGKTGVNTPQGKNLLGAFWQPALVYIAVETLKTLSDPELRCGLGEVVKHAVLEEDPVDYSPRTEFFEWLQKNGSKLVQRDPDALNHAIKRCCEIKAGIVSQDETETGKRALLNLGHTAAHAIEHVMGYGAIRHGEAVGIGTVAEAQLAVRRQAAPKDLPIRIAKLLQVCGLPHYLKGLDVDKLMEAVLSDKKMSGGMITITVPHEIGHVTLEEVHPDDLRYAFECLPSNEKLVSQL